MIGWIGLILNNITVLSALSNISNIKKIFNKTWSHMKFKNRLVSKKISLRCLNRACGGEDLDELSAEIADVYFEKIR